MPKVTYDTSVFIACKSTGLPAGFVMSAVVIQELTAGAVDKSDIQRFGCFPSRARTDRYPDGRLHAGKS
jgi:hypothetical protein